MSSCSRCFESSKQAKLAEGADRISGLPDEILGHILCFLPTKYAVGTSVLSHRWQYLFTLITNFDFDETLVFSSRGSVASYHDLSESKLNSLCKRYSKGYSKFKCFVDRVLMLCKPTHMNKFRLNCAKTYDSNHIKRWIEFALLKGVSELDVFTYQFNSSVTQQLFVCATLVVLKLHGKFEMKLPESYFLPNLKFLQLKSGKFPEKFPLNSLISGCPMLEDLVIEGRWGYDVKVITISSPTLINLTLNFTTTSFGWPRTDVLLDLPNLLHFNYEDFLACHYCINFNSLVDARIRTVLKQTHDDYEPPQNFRDSMIELLHGVSGAKHLHLSGHLEALEYGEYKLPSFNHLSCLNLDLSGLCNNWEHFLPAFLHSSPVVENLVFPGVGRSFSSTKSPMCEDKCFWNLQTPPSCLSSHLKTITIGSFHGLVYEELNITKYFLRYGKVLTKLILCCKLRSKQEYTELKKLFKIGRLASKECSLDLMIE